MNGELVHTLPFGYGYGDYYEQRAQEWLQNNGYINAEQHPNGSRQPLWQIANDHGIKYSRNVTEVARKRDL